MAFLLFLTGLEESPNVGNVGFTLLFRDMIEVFKILKRFYEVSSNTLSLYLLVCFEIL